MAYHPDIYYNAGMPEIRQSMFTAPSRIHDRMGVGDGAGPSPARQNAVNPVRSEEAAVSVTFWVRRQRRPCAIACFLAVSYQ